MASSVREAMLNRSKSDTNMLQPLVLWDHRRLVLPPSSRRQSFGLFHVQNQIHYTQHNDPKQLPQANMGVLEIMGIPKHLDTCVMANNLS